MKSSRKTWARGALLMAGSVLAAALLTMVVQQMTLASIVDAAEGLDFRFILAGFASLAAGYGLRIIRWRTVLTALVPEPKRQWTTIELAPSFLASFALNNLLPFRSGDVARVVLVVGTFGAPVGPVVTAMIIERAFDFMVLLILLGFGARFVSLNAPAVVPVDLVWGLALGGVVALGTIIALGPSMAYWILAWSRGSALGRRGATILRTLSSTVDAFGVIGHWSTLLSVTCLSLGAWACEASTVLFVGFAMEIQTGWLTNATAMAAANLATLIPGTPGHFGTYHYAFMSVLKSVGIEGAVAANHAVVSHLVIWGGTTIAGLAFAFALLGRQALHLRRDIPENA